MTKEQTKAAIAVMQAYVDGKVIQFMRRDADQAGWSQTWWKEACTPTWDWHIHEFRIKPEPREWWINCGYVYEHLPIAGKGFIKVREVLE